MFQHRLYDAVCTFAVLGDPGKPDDWPWLGARNQDPRALAPLPCLPASPGRRRSVPAAASKSENQIGTQNQEVIDSSLAPTDNPDSPLEQALQQLSGAIKGRLLMNKDGGMVPAT